MENKEVVLIPDTHLDLDGRSFSEPDAKLVFIPDTRLDLDGTAGLTPDEAVLKIFKECQEIKQQRGAVYGSFRDDYARVAALYQDRIRNGVNLSPEEKGLIFMQCVKWGRLCVTPDHRDSHIDLLNYINMEQAIRDATS